MDKRISRGATECSNPLCFKESTKVIRMGNRTTYVCDSMECESVMTETIQERRDLTQNLANYLPKKRGKKRDGRRTDRDTFKKKIRRV